MTAPIKPLSERKAETYASWERFFKSSARHGYRVSKEEQREIANANAGWSL
jgi:hypothetical protein